MEQLEGVGFISEWIGEVEESRDREEISEEKSRRLIFLNQSRKKQKQWKIKKDIYLKGAETEKGRRRWSEQAAGGGGEEYRTT